MPLRPQRRERRSSRAPRCLSARTLFPEDSAVQSRGDHAGRGRPVVYPSDVPGQLGRSVRSPCEYFVTSNGVIQLWALWSGRSVSFASCLMAVCRSPCLECKYQSHIARCSLPCSCVFFFFLFLGVFCVILVSVSLAGRIAAKRGKTFLSSRNQGLIASKI